MATVLGTPVVFGLQGTNGITISGISGTILQSVDHSAEADREDIRNGVGDIVTQSFYDPHRKITLEWVVSAASLANALAANSLTPVIPGTLITITTCTSHPDLVATNWVVMSARAANSNTTSVKHTVQLEKRAGITAVAT